MQELNKTSLDLRFYHSKFPMCDGLTEADWKYEHHTSFELDADYMAEYVLHVNDNQVKTRGQWPFRPAAMLAMESLARNNQILYLTTL